MNVSSAEVLAEARRQLHDEQFKAAVAKAKHALLTRKTWGQRIAAALPFTISWKSK